MICNVKSFLAVSILTSALLVDGRESWAMLCTQQPLDEVIENADAIFTGRIRSVDFLPEPSSPSLCRYDGVKCGGKIATVQVRRVWKGEVEKTAYVYSEDACYCLGTYFEKGQERLFIVKHSDRRAETSIKVARVDFQTAFCGRSPMLKSAVKKGTVDQLDKYFGD